MKKKVTKKAVKKDTRTAMHVKVSNATYARLHKKATTTGLTKGQLVEQALRKTL